MNILRQKAMNTAPCLGHVDGGELAASTGHKRLDSKSTSINRLFVPYPVVVWYPTVLIISEVQRNPRSLASRVQRTEFTCC